MKAIIGFSLITAAFGYAVWCSLFQTGLYAILVRWQAVNFDTYFPGLTFTAIFLILLVPLYFFELALGVRKGKPKSNTEISLHELNVRLKQRSRGYFLLILLLAAGSFGAYYFAQAAPGQDQPTIQVDLSNYQEESYWFKKVQLNGILLTQSAFTITSKSNKRSVTSETQYTPIGLRNGSAPIHFVHIKTANENVRVSSTLAMNGFVMPWVLPVLVRDTFEADGLDLADTVHLIGDSIVSLQFALFITTGILALLAFIFLVVLIILPIARRRLINEWHAVNGV